MGWGHIKLPDGREVGYCVDATCEHPGCTEKIDRGLAFVCGGMHEGGEHGCGHYFCEKHLETAIGADDEFIEDAGRLCATCCKRTEEEHGVKFDENGTRLNPDDVEEVASAGPAIEATSKKAHAQADA